MRERGNKVMVVDGGGRGAVLVDKYAQSDQVDEVLAVPGNEMMSGLTEKPVKIFPKLKTTSGPDIVDLCEREGVDLVDVAQDNAIEIGVVDILRQRGISVVGPTRAAGQIEWDKAWAREFGERHGLPQPSFQICLSLQEGIDFVNSEPDQPWFIKAAGLAEGKGALPAKNRDEAIKRIHDMAESPTLKKAGEVFIVEKWLKGDDGSAGEEFSTFVFSDGENFKIIGSAQDHKRVNDFDEGDNTGGMGSSTPPRVLTPELMAKVQYNIIEKVIAGLHDAGRPYNGVLYLGGMAVRQEGELNPYVVEFNSRWGDPEAEVILPGLINDLFQVGCAIASGSIEKVPIINDGRSRVVVAATSKGYPSDYSAVKGKQIYGVDDIRKMDGVKVYGAGVKVVDGKHFANGGRLFYIVGEGNTVIQAREKAYEAMSIVSIEGNNLHFRTDIGWRDVQRLRQE